MAYAAGAADVNKPLVVRIAHGGPVSGPIAALGKDEENGVRMAIEDLNARKLQLGGRNVQWKLEAGDDAGDPGQATSLARMFSRNISRSRRFKASAYLSRMKAQGPSSENSHERLRFVEA